MLLELRKILSNGLIEEFDSKKISVSADRIKKISQKTEKIGLFSCYNKVIRSFTSTRFEEKNVRGYIIYVIYFYDIFNFERFFQICLTSFAPALPAEITVRQRATTV